MSDKKRWLIFAAILLAGLAALPAAGRADMGPAIRGNGDIVSQERQAQGFATVELEGAGNLRIHPGDEHRVVVTTDGNLQELVTTRVKGSALVIRSERINPSRLTIDVYLPDLRGVSLSGAGSASVGAFAADAFGVSMAGSWRVAFAGGSADSLRVSIAGSGRVDMEDFRAGAVSVRISGSGNVRTWAEDSLHVSISGSGTVAHRGSPAISFNRAGAGRIRRI